MGQQLHVYDVCIRPQTASAWYIIKRKRQGTKAQLNLIYSVSFCFRPSCFCWSDSSHKAIQSPHQQQLSSVINIVVFPQEVILINWWQLNSPQHQWQEAVTHENTPGFLFTTLERLFGQPLAWIRVTMLLQMSTCTFDSSLLHLKK